MNELIFSGGSHYGTKALKSLQNVFSMVYILADNDPEILDMKREKDIIISDFDDVGCKYVFLGGHKNFITSKQLENKIYINVHGALLPKYRGMHSTFWAIMNGEEKLGITYHLVDEFMDSGDILKQFSFQYTGQSVLEINQLYGDFIERYTGDVVLSYINSEIIPVKQDKSLATWGCKRNLADCLIDFEWSNLIIERFFKALTEPYPLPQIKYKDNLFEITKFNIVNNDYFGAIGRIVNIDNEGLWIKTKEGFLIVKELRIYETKEKVNMKDFFIIGARLENNKR